MASTNLELVQLMKELNLDQTDVARHLDVPLDVVNQWMVTSGQKKGDEMPESELKLLKFALMSDNRNTHLF